MRSRLSHWLLAALLVVSQLTLLVHSADIDGHTHGAACSLCLLVHGLDQAVPNQFSLPAGKFEAPEYIAVRSISRARQSGSYYPTRAPPLQTLPA